MASRNMNAKPDYVPPVPADLTKAWFLDCALRTGLRAPAATLTPTATGRTSQPFITPQNATVLPDIVYSIVGADNIAGGLGYTAPTVLVIDQLGTGSGAVAHAVVNGDTSITVVVDAAGQNYQQPDIPHHRRDRRRRDRAAHPLERRGDERERQRTEEPSATSCA
jgi:hypothetical protein